ncbi:hypothetical protein HRI96_08755 [Treponema parvum]|uniref:Uncharacterized protein n=1 Tax=Treponema parvum TaxID=138851 RepID=A0A975F1C6_9SPIR|nr:hypothetical protein [Treponema parvum]QTQ12279.1 hypothetical protein HRI96_08755 [Treponema parvum]
MAKKSIINILLKFYANRLNTYTVDYDEFISYVKKYAQIHVEEQPDLVMYLGNADAQIEKDLEELEADRKVLIINNDKKRTIFVITMYVQKFEKLYQEIVIKPTTPFPTISDLPKSVPTDILYKKNASDYLHGALKKQETDDKILYCLSLPHEIPPIIVPSSLKVSTLGEICMAKIRLPLQKEEYRGYFAKKLHISNQGKELATKNFFDKFVNFSNDIIDDLKEPGDNFYFWTQLCYFIRQDYESIKDRTPEDINVLQAIYIAEIIISFYKDKIKQENQKREALEYLKKALQKPPYYFTINDITGIVNAKGVPLTKLYTDDDLKAFLEKETSNNADEGSSHLPDLLVFKVQSKTLFFIYKDKILPLIVRLCNEAHDTVGKIITENWIELLRNFTKVPEMYNQAKYEEILRSKTEKMAPILYALLNANFLLTLTYELRAKSAEIPLPLFEHDRLAPYSSLLLLKQQDLLASAKFALPFWYSIPIVSWLISLFTKKPEKHKQNPSGTAFQKVNYDQELAHSIKQPVSKGKALAQAAQALERHFVQEGSTVERDMDSYAKIWNKMIDKKNRVNLEEDVNALIRDYIRNVFNTLNGVTFDENRLENLANTLCNTPNMKRIGEPEALNMYVRMYILHLLKGLT